MGEKWFGNVISLGCRYSVKYIVSRRLLPEMDVSRSCACKETTIRGEGCHWMGANICVIQQAPGILNIPHQNSDPASKRKKAWGGEELNSYMIRMFYSKCYGAKAVWGWKSPNLYRCAT